MIDLGQAARVYPALWKGMKTAQPSAIDLTLKAGCVGITLTRANHVFHFDRWWNPVVEDQAADRAFRICRTKNEAKFNRRC